MATSTIPQTINNSGTNYCKMPDGTLIQWGTSTIPANSYVFSPTFQVSFIDTNYVVSLSPNEAGLSFNYGTKRVSNFQFGRTPNTAANTFDWIAIGRWK